MKVAAEALLVGEAGNAHDHRVAELVAAEELQRGGLAAQLVEGVVQVGEVLDLGDRQQARHGRTLGDAQDRGLVEQRVEDAPAAEALLQAVGHVVHAALAPDVLAEEDELGPPRQLVGQGRVDAAGQGSGGRQRRRLGERSAECLAPLLVRAQRVPCPGADAARVVGRHRPGDFGDGRQPRAARCLLGGGRHACPRVGDEGAQLCGGRRAALDQATGVAQQRIGCLGPRDLGQRAVPLLGVAAGVAPQTHRLELQEQRPALVAHEPDGAFDAIPYFVELAVGAQVGEVRLVAERLRDPSGWRVDADAGAVVLAYEQDRHGQADARGIPRGVEGRQRRGVVGAGIAERAHHDGIGRETVLDAQAASASQAERHAHRLGQVAGDGAGLRRNPQRATAPHLVAALGDGILARGDDAEQRVEHRRAARQLAGAGEHEGARAVVQEGRIGQAQLSTERGVLLVSGRADGVEAAIRLLQLACGNVELPAGDLVLEQLQPATHRQAPSRVQGSVQREAVRRGGSVVE